MNKIKMNELEKYFYNNQEKRIYKYKHYFEIYDEHFSKFKGKDISLLEIGVLGGGSLQMWQSYFGDNAKIYGIDIDPVCRNYEEENIKIFIGSQSDKSFLEHVKKNTHKFDIVIDDGGHKMSEQIKSFKYLIEHVNENGIYLCEDTHSSYMLQFGGGFRRKGTFIEYCKKQIDYLTAHFSEQKRFKRNYITDNIHSIHFYDSIVVFDKRKREKPEVLITGQEPHNHISKYTTKQKLILTIAYNILMKINAILRIFRLPSIILK